MSEQQTYSHLDIKRYLQQQMSAQEMHAFERAMMDDPFLADAVEGISESDEKLANKHLEQIKESILGEKEKAKVVALPKSKNQWWRVAAAIFVIASGSILTYSLLNNSAVQKTTVNEMASAGAVNAAPMQDSIKAQEQPLVQNQVQSEVFAPKQRNSPIIKTENEPLASAAPEINNMSAKESSSDDYNNDKGDMVMEQPAIAKDQKITKEKAILPIELENKKQNLFNGRVTDDNGNAIPFATVRSGSNITSTDANGGFKLQAPDSVLKVDVSSVGYAMARADVQSNTPAKITLEESKSSLSEVVVTGITSKRKAASSTVNSSKISGSSAEPVGGWNNFRQYVNRSVDSLSNDDEEVKITGVAVEFTVDNNGAPTDIKVNAAPNKTISDKASEIIRNGPKWSSKSKKERVKVSIPF